MPHQAKGRFMKIKMILYSVGKLNTAHPDPGLQSIVISTKMNKT